MAKIFWETESQTKGGVTLHIYYLYIDQLQKPSGGKLDDGGDTEGPDFIHMSQVRMRQEFVAWRAAMAWFAGGAYHYIVTQTHTATSGKILAIPVSSGPGACAVRTEYLFNVRDYWQACSEKAVSLYTGFTANDLVMRERVLFGGSAFQVRTSDEVHGQPVPPVYIANAPTTQAEWDNWTKGILNDLTGSATKPILGTLGSHDGVAFLQTSLAFNFAVTVRALDVHFAGDPNEIRLQHGFTGLSSSPFDQINPITGSYPSVTAGRTIHVAQFTFSMGVTGEVKGAGFISIQAFKDGSPHVNGDQGRTITFTIEPLGYVRPPPYSCPTIDGKMIPGGYVPG